MANTSYSKTIAHSAVISVFLATSAIAQSWIGSQPREQIYISIVNTPVGDGTFVPTVQIENAFGSLTQIKIGQDGLTRAILYNEAAITAWVLARYGQTQNPQVIFDNRTGDDDEEVTPPPAVEPETKTEEKTETKTEEKTDETKDDCVDRTNADITSIDDLPIISVQVPDCDREKILPCPALFETTADHPMIWRIGQDYPCGNVIEVYPTDS